MGGYRVPNGMMGEHVNSEGQLTGCTALAFSPASLDHARSEMLPIVASPSAAEKPSGRPLYTYTEQGNRRRTHKPTPRQKERARVAVFTRDGFACQGCGVRPYEELPPGWHGERTLYTERGPLHLDHVKPYCDGGEFTVENLRTLCEKCNCGRGARS